VREALPRGLREQRAHVRALGLPCAWGPWMDPGMNDPMDGVWLLARDRADLHTPGGHSRGESHSQARDTRPGKRLA